MPRMSTSTKPGTRERAQLRVLVVDDETSVGFFIARILRPWDVTVVADGLSAAQRIAEGGWDVIVCDLTLPGMDGPTLYERASPDQRRRFVFMTGGAYTAEAERFLAACRAPTLYKPFDPAELRVSIEHVANEVGRAALG